MADSNKPVMGTHIQTGNRCDVVFGPKNEIGLWAWDIPQDGVIWLKDPQTVVQVLQEAIDRERNIRRMAEGKVTARG